MPTVRVRIAVAVNDKGDVGAAVSHNGEDDEAKSFALELLGEPSNNERVTFVEADVPLPETETVEGQADEDLRSSVE